MRYPLAGTIVSVDFSIYNHQGIVTDSIYQGRPMVISNSCRRRGVYEEPWDWFACEREVRLVYTHEELDVEAVLHRARSCIGSNWHLLSWNCEHFVSWSCGNKPTSPQIQSLLTGVVAIAGTALLGWFANISKWPFRNPSI